MHVCKCCIKCIIKHNEILVLCFSKMLHGLLVQLDMQIQQLGDY
jgi:hypothetical protein